MKEITELKLLVDSKSADVALKYGEDETIGFEYWWIIPSADRVLVMSHCLQNYPPAIICTMKYREARREYIQLRREGWKRESLSSEMVSVFQKAKPHTNN